MRIALYLLFAFICATSEGTTIRWEPPYPEEAVQKCIEGYVVLRYEVGPDALPINIEVVNSEPDDVFDKSAIQALSRWQQEEPPGTRKEQTIEFTIDDASECNS